MVTLKEAFDLYLEDLRARQLSASTIETAVLRIGRLVDFLAPITAAAVDTADVTAFFEHLEGLGLANGTLAGYKSSQRAFWNWAIAAGLVESSPARVLAQRRFNYSFRPVNHQPADKDDFQAVVDSLMAFAAHREYEPRDIRDALAVSLTMDSSVRRAEVWNLRRADMERALRRGRPVGEGRLVYMAAVPGKTETAIVRFYDETAKLAWLWLDAMPVVARGPQAGETAVWLFCSLRTGKRLAKDYMGSAFIRVCKFAGVPTFRYQAVRKRTIMDSIALSGDQKVGQVLAGHKDARTTAEYYNLLQQEEVNALAGKLATARRGRPDAAGESLARELFDFDE